MQSSSNLDKWKEIGAFKTVIEKIENGALPPFPSCQSLQIFQKESSLPILVMIANGNKTI